MGFLILPLIIVLAFLNKSIVADSLRGQKLARDTSVYTTTLHKQSFGPLNHLVSSKRNDPIDLTEVHANAMHDAIKKGKKSFKVIENRQVPQDHEVKTIEDVTSHFGYDAVSEYSLKNDITFVSFDDANVSQNLLEISSNELLYCGKVDMETVFVSTHSGSESHRGLKEFLASDERATKSTGFAQIRKAAAISPVTHRDHALLSAYGKDAKNCHRVQTENLHQLEVFESFKIESTVDHPFAQELQNPPKEKAEDIELEGEYPVHPDNGVILCNNPWWTGGAMGSNDDNDDDGFTDNIGWTYGCVQYTAGVPGSFNFNYNSATKQAKQSLNIANGVTCPNCYAYLGAGYLVIMQYSWTYGFAFEVKAAGGAGFNINLQVSNPSISGSKTQQLMGSSSWQYLSIGTTGLSLGFQLGGLTSTLSGSASATGSVSFTAGAGFSASLGVEFANGKLTFPNTFSDNYNPPNLVNNNFQVSAASVSMILGATENLQLNYLSTAKATFSVIVSPTVSLGWGAGVGNAAFTVSHSHRSKSSKKFIRHAVGAASDGGSSHPNYYLPGDEVSIHFTYTDLPFKNANLTVFYSLSNGILIWPFMTRDIVTSSTGSGTHTAKWTLPWNQRFVTSERWKIVVHTSIAMNTYIEDEVFRVKIYSAEDTIFTSEMPSIVQVGENGYTFTATWNSELLNYYKVKPGNGGHGSHQVCDKVAIYLNGATKGSTSPLLQVPLTGTSKIKNDGKAKLTIPAGVDIGTASAFYLTVQCSANYDTLGWSKGWFELSGHVKSDVSGGPSRKLLPEKSSALLGVVELTPPAKTDIPVTGNQLERKLSVCPSGTPASLTYSLPARAGLASASILGFTFAGNNYMSFSLMDPTIACYSN